MGFKRGNVIKRFVILFIATVLLVCNLGCACTIKANAAELDQGIDLSFWQGDVDWNQIAASGVKFAFIRLGNLSQGLDAKFYRNMAGAQAVGIKTGVYLYSSALTLDQVVMEAAFVTEALKNVSVSLPVVYDIEDKSQSYLSKETLALFVNTFCALIEQQGYYPMVYANTNWFQKKLGYIPYDKWVAQWNGRCDIPGACVWQYTSKASVPGIKGNMDRDVMLKDYDSMFIHTGFVNRNGYIYYLINYRVYKGLLDLGTAKYFLDEYGHLYTGLLPVGDSYYYFKEDGQMATGFTFIDNKIYLFGNDGLMLKGMQKVGTDTFFFNADGTMFTGFLTAPDGIRYFGSDGKMATGLVAVDKNVYFFDNSGIMQTGIVDCGGAYLYFDETGKFISELKLN